LETFFFFFFFYSNPAPTQTPGQEIRTAQQKVFRAFSSQQAVGKENISKIVMMLAGKTGFQ
jgi:hypothetical protein